jgi:hypothetical protein
MQQAQAGRRRETFSLLRRQVRRYKGSARGAAAAREARETWRSI